VVVRHGDVLASQDAALTLQSPKPGWSEQDPVAWIAATCAAVHGALAAAGKDARDVAGISLSGQMHGAVMLDATDNPVRPCILWNDNRSVAQCAELSRGVPDIGYKAGIPPLPGFTAPKLMWVAQHDAAAFAQIKTILMPKDFIGLWLTGEKGTDYSDAAGTCWLNQADHAWDPKIIEASGIDPAWLPPLMHGFDRLGTVRGDVAQQLGLSAACPVFAGGGDAATGALSLGAAHAGQCFMSLGTSGQLLTVDAQYQPNPDQFVHAYCHTVPGTWYRMAAMLNGARPLAWFAGVLGCDVAHVLDQAAQANPDRVPVFLPYLTGERSPHGDPDVRGGFYGLEDATGQPEMCRAVVEAVCFMMRDALDSFGDTFQPNGPIPVIGGGSRSDLLLGWMADVLDMPVARAEAGAGRAAFGAAILAEVGTGARTVQDMAFAPMLSQQFLPRANDHMAGRLVQYRDLYNRVRGGL
ncbi:MAG: xylulokinase, partial [Pseudomonadota bacterium]